MSQRINFSNGSDFTGQTTLGKGDAPALQVLGRTKADHLLKPCGKTRPKLSRGST